VKFLAEIEILPKKGLLDPQGKAVTQSMPRIGITQVSEVRVGRFITLDIDANSEQDAQNIADTAAKKLLANLIMEDYRVRITAL
jgi:phosphoribosylformylglycinamidine synthase